MTEGRRLEKEVVLDATPEQVWEAITTSQGLASWLFPMEVEPDEDGTSPAGTVTAWEPGKHFAVRTPEAEDGSFQAFEYLLEARDGGTAVLRFVHSGFQGDGWETEYDATSKGWDMYFHTLDQYLTYFYPRTATYVLAEGPQVSAEEQAWPVVLAGLGLAGEVAAGEKVRLTPNGVAPIEGVVDYVGPSFLGVRTTDAMYRFHGRALLGMPVAVGHHIFADDVDQQETVGAWKAWLDRLFPESA